MARRRSPLPLLAMLLGLNAWAPPAPASAVPAASDTPQGLLALGEANGRSLRERGSLDPLTGVRSPLPKDWVGLRSVAPDTPILVMAGHADAQGIAGPGTSGAAVALRGAAPMYVGITDELYWNMVVAEAVVELGQRRGLQIRYHRPPYRNIQNGDEEGTNWSEGRRHAQAGGYALEIHFDAYGPTGVGSGLIPALHRPFSTIDESLAREFGGYPMGFRDGLGGPRRGISLLEIGKLEGTLEEALRDPDRRARTVWAIASRVVDALERGLRPQPGAVGSASRGRDLRASSADE